VSGDRILAVALAAVFVATLVACGWLRPDTVPYTERKRPELMYTEQQMAEFGRESFAEIEKKYQTVTGTAASARVARVGRRTANATGKKWDWEFRLFEDDDVANAFCLPGGKIGVFTGILPMVKSDSDMAVILSHEIAHAVLQHSNERMSKPLAAKLVGMPTSMAVGVWGAISPAPARS